MNEIFKFQHKETVNQDNCANYKAEELELPGDVSYGVEKQFSYQARTALRLAHFLSNFLQVSKRLVTEIYLVLYGLILRQFKMWNYGLCTGLRLCIV